MKQTPTSEQYTASRARIRRAAHLLRAAALLLLASGCGGQPEGERIVLITLDTLRADSFAGSVERPSSMPRTLARARSGLVFERFYAATSTTQPSHASMLTGLHPWEHGVTRNGQILREELPTVAELLAEAGWATGAAVAAFPVAARFGFGQGFGDFREEFGGGRFATLRWEGHGVPEGRFLTTAEAVTRAGIELLDRVAGRRQFLWLHYFDAHTPYGLSTGDPVPGPRRVLTRAEQGLPVAAALARNREAYEADVAHLDGWLDRLFRRLDEDAGSFATHVVAASDHGESFGEGGAIAHGLRLTPEQIRVPLFILSPRVAPARRRDVAGSIDVAATLLALAGLDPEALGGTGRDLTRRPAGPARAFGMRRTFRRTPVERRAEGSARPLEPYLFYAVDPEGEMRRGHGTGRTDPEDGRPLPPALGRLFGLWQGETEQRPDAGPLSPEVASALRALGYVD